MTEIKTEGGVSKVIAYIVITFGLIFFAIALKDSTWQGDVRVHLELQLIAAIFAFFVSGLAFLRFYSTRVSSHLLIAMAFIGTAGLEMYHVVVSANNSIQVLNNVSHENVVLWSWYASRVYLSILFFATAIFAFIENRRNQSEIASPKSIIFLSSFFAVFILAFFVFVQPGIIFTEIGFLQQPFELIPGVFFSLALFLYLLTGTWRTKIYEHWIVIALIISALTQFAFSVFSSSMFDIHFNIAHAWKIVSYTSVMTALVISLFGVVTQYRDDKKLLEIQKKSIQESKVRADAIMDNMGDGLVVTNSERQVVLVNNAALVILHQKREDLIGRTWPDYHDTTGKNSCVYDEKGKMAKIERLPVSIALTELRRYSSNDYLYERADGSRFAVSITASPLKLSDDLAGTVVLFRDITQEKALGKIQNDFIATASHQLRTPLTGIQWVTERILKTQNLTDQGKEYINDIHTSAKRLNSLVNLLLDASRIQSGKIGIIPEKLEVVTYIEQYIEEVRPLLEKKNLTLNYVHTASELVVLTDVTVFRNILQSIVSNAIEYTPQNGSIKITLDDSSSQTFMISVEDTGIGIPREELPTIFEKFTRGSNARLVKTDGTGLGLYISKEAVELMGGTITADSTVNKGTTFYINLPRETVKIEGEKQLGV